MILARVTGSVHATVKNAHLEGQRMLVCRPLDLDLKVKGKPLLCVDRVDSGVGDTVLINREGGSARLIYANDRIPVQAVIIAVVDDVEVQA